MLTSIEGTYCKGKIVLKEQPEITDETPVIVTFMGSKGIDLGLQGIRREQASELQDKLSSFQDWNNPEMDVYDDYDNAKNRL